MTKDDILQILKEQKDIMQNRFSVSKIGLFGSYAKDKQTSQSDLDFYVEFEKKSFNNLAGLWVYLEKLYNRKVDIVYKHKNSNSKILKNIEQETIYG